MNTSILPSISMLAARRTAITLIVVAAIAGAYAISILNQPAPASVAYPAIRYGMANSAGRLDAAPLKMGTVRHSHAAAGSSTLPVYVIKTGDITIKLKAKSVLPAKQSLADMLRIFSVPGGQGAYIASVSTYDHNRFLDMQIAVPAQYFSAVFHRLEHNFGKIQNESTSTQNVGLRVVNLNARLKNLAAQRTALLKLFAHATTVSDTVKVENVLSSVEGQIEQTQSDIKYLDHQIDMSTISVEFQAKNATKHHHSAGPIINAFGTAGNGIVGVIAGAIIVVGYAIPLAGLGLCLYGLVLLGLRLLRRRRTIVVPVPA